MATVTFLFVDQVGSTEQMSSLGDAGAREVREALFELLRRAVAEAGGREVDAAGDGLFSAFEGAGAAVDAAVAIQQHLWSYNQHRDTSSRLSVRVGLNTGEPLQREDGGYFGTAVVVAARLCAVAEGDQVLVSDIVRSLVAPRGDHVFASLGSRALKGVPEPVPVFELHWEPPAAQEQLPGELESAAATPFVGRVPELAALEAAWDAVQGGGRRVVAVSGDHGMGATRLVAQFARRTLTDGATVWSGRASAGSGHLVAWGEAVSGWVASAPTVELRAALGAGVDALARWVPALVPHADHRAPAAQGTQGSQGVDDFLVADALNDVLARCSRRAPVLVVLDHLEEADEDTLAVLRRLATSRRGGRVLFLACYVPSEVGTSRVLSVVRQLPGVTDVRLGGLDRAEVAALIEAVTGAAPSPERVAAVRAESEGSPYFVSAMALAHYECDLSDRVGEAVERAEGLRIDLRLQREEILLGLRELDQLRAPGAAVDGVVVDADGTPPADVPNPYKGLLSFTSEDAGDFSGREALVSELVARLVTSRFLGVVGTSGSGKSSVVRAGLLPALAAGAVPSSASWTPLVLTPGADPVASLAAALAERCGAGEAAVAERLLVDPLGEVAAASGLGPLVVVVDQGEELWTASSSASRDRFVDLLTAAAGDPDHHVVVVLVLRSDYYGRVGAHPQLAALLTESQVIVGPLTPAQLRAVVEAPARRAGLVLEPGLAQAVVDDAGGAPGALPLVSTALVETWQRRRGRSLTLTGYAEAGGVRRAIARLADDTYLGLPRRDRTAARRLLLRLATPGADGDDVARRAPLGEVGDDDTSRRVLDLFARRRLVTVGERGVQVAHEALLREWPRLREWLDADRDGRRLHQQLAAAASEWESGGRDDDALLRGARLAAAVDWQAAHRGELTAQERDFVKASAQRRDVELRRALTSERRLRRLAAGLVVVLAVALAAGSFAVVQRGRADRRADEAVAQRLSGTARDLAATDLPQALLLAVAAEETQSSAQSRSGLAAVLDRAGSLTDEAARVPSDTAGLATTPDGRQVLVCSYRLRGVWYDAGTWQPSPGPAVECPGPGSFISPDSSKVVGWSPDGVEVVDLSTGKTTISGPASSVVVSVDGRRLALADDDAVGTVRTYDTTSGALLSSVASGVPHPVIEDGATAADAFLVSTTSPPVIRRFTFDGAPPSPTSLTTDLPDVQHPALSPDGSALLLVSSVGGASQVVDVATGRPRGAVNPPGLAAARAAVWSPSGAVAAITLDDGSVQVVDGRTGGLRQVVHGVGDVHSAQFLDDDHLAVVISSRVRVLALGYASALSARVPAAAVLSTASDAEGDGVWTGEAGKLVHRRSADLATLAEWPVNGAVYRLAVSRDGRTASAIVLRSASTAEDLQSYLRADAWDAEVIDLTDGHVISDVPLASGSDAVVTSRPVALGRDRITVVTGDVVQVRDVATGAEIGPPIGVPDHVAVGSWSSSGGTLYLGGPSPTPVEDIQPGPAPTVDPTVQAVAAASGVVSWTRTLPTSGSLTSMATFGNHDDRLVIGTSDGDLFVVDARTGHLRAHRSLGRGRSDAVAATPDGHRLVSASAAGAIDVTGPSAALSLGGQAAAESVTSVAVAEHGTRLLVGSADTADLSGHVQSVIIDPEAWECRACALAGRDLTVAEWRTHLPGQRRRPLCPVAG